MFELPPVLRTVRQATTKQQVGINSIEKIIYKDFKIETIRLAISSDSSVYQIASDRWAQVIVI
jgi:hypothetical protein